MTRLPAMLACCAVPLLAAGAATPPTLAEFKAMAGRHACTQPNPGHLIFAGGTDELGACLAKAEGGEIAELRITSGGGGAWTALDLARRYRGHIDLVIVQGMCVSSCANYFLPAAKRLRVAEHSYVLLHGSISVRDFDTQKKQAAAMLREHTPGMNDADVAAKIAEIRATIAAEEPVQQAFARDTLACGDWLDVQLHPLAGAPATTRFLLVTPEMARRCLKTTHVEAFWPPEAQSRLAPELGLFRAQH